MNVLFRAECKIALRALLFAVPATILTVLLNLGLIHLEDVVEASGMPTITDDGIALKPTTWLAVSGFVMLLLEFRTQQALDRFWEGTSLLHRMRGEWFDSASCLVTFALLSADAKPKEVAAFRHTIVRLMSLCHASALEEIADFDFEIPRLDYEGISQMTRFSLRTRKHKYGFNRVEMVLKLIYSSMTKALDDGVLNIPAPILTRVYQTLSRGFVCNLNAKKIKDTRFPFPYAQMIAALLLIMLLGIPCVMAMLIRNVVWAAVFTFVPIFGVFSLNFIAMELENPFGQDENDLPLAHFQAEMNSSLLMLLHGLADHEATVTESAVRDFSELARQAKLTRASRGLAKALPNLEHSSSRMSDFENFIPSADATWSVDGTWKLESEKPEGELAARRLAASMLEFNRTLQRWTQTVECQVGELRRSYNAVKKVVNTHANVG